MKILAIAFLMGISFAAGWVTSEKYTSTKEPNNNDEDQSNNLFV